MKTVAFNNKRDGLSITTWLLRKNPHGIVYQNSATKKILMELSTKMLFG